MLIDSGKVIYKLCQEPPFTITREELKKDADREEFKNLITQGWRRTEEDWIKRELGLLILNSQSNNTQLLIEGRASSKRFIEFNLFLPESKSINLTFLLANLL